MRDNKKIALRAILLAGVLIIGAIERLIPFEFAVPGVKLGLSNAVLLVALYILTFWDALLITVLKCCLNLIITGSAGAFIFSLCGSLLALFGMSALIKTAKNKLSPVGISAAGAVLHNSGQLLAASALTGRTEVFYYLPVLLVSGVLTGILTGYAAKYVLNILKK